MYKSSFSRIASAAFLAACAALFLTSCGQKKQTIVQETNAAAQTTAAPTTAAPTTAAAEITTAPASPETAPEAPAPGTNVKLKAAIQTYEKGSVKIQYPVISGMNDASQQEKLNEHLKENALSVLTNYPDSKEPMDQEKDSLEVRCDVISADTGRVIAIYHGTYNMQGAAHPVNLFYTNTVDVRSLQDASLKNAADPYTLAVFALADDVVLKDADAETLKAYKDWKSSVSVEQYQECLEKADFPLRKAADGKSVVWPESFSYESAGNLFYAVPVPHALGDYVIVEYDVVTK